MIYYSNVNEDNFIERRLINAGSFQDLFCIAGSGERLISLLDHPSIKRVYIIDHNEEAIFLIQLKLMALKKLRIKTYLEFVGADLGQINRIELFEKFKEDLPLSCRKYWENRLELIEKGVLNSGHFERFLSRIRPMLKSYLGKGFYNCFKKPLTTNDHFPFKKWAVIKYIFSKRWAYLLAGNKDLSFIAKDAEPFRIPAAFHRTITEDKVYSNCLFHLVFQGSFCDMSKDFIPPSMNTKVLEKVKMKLEEKDLEIYFHQEDMLEFCKGFEFDQTGHCFFSLSDILSFIDLDYIKELLGQINQKTINSSSIVLRAFLRNRIEISQLNDLSFEFGPVVDLTEQEQTGMYQVIALELKK